MTISNTTNLKRSIEKEHKLVKDLIDAYNEGMSPYHLNKKAEALKSQLEKVASLFEEIPDEDVIPEEWEIFDDLDYRFVGRAELESQDAFENLKGKRFELWTKPPGEIRLPYMSIKPLEFFAELREMRTRRENGYIVYEVRE